MTEIDAQEVGASYTCLQPGCVREAKSSRGPYSKCDVHRLTPPRPAAAAAADTSTESKLRALGALARDVDKARKRAVSLTTQALEAKREVDELEARFKQELEDATARYD